MILDKSMDLTAENLKHIVSTLSSRVLVNASFRAENNRIKVSDLKLVFPDGTVVVQDSVEVAFSDYAVLESTEYSLIAEYMGNEYGAQLFFNIVSGLKETGAVLAHIKYSGNSIPISDSMIIPFTRKGIVTKITPMDLAPMFANAKYKLVSDIGVTHTLLWEDSPSVKFNNATTVTKSVELWIPINQEGNYSVELDYMKSSSCQVSIVYGDTYKLTEASTVITHKKILTRLNNNGYLKVFITLEPNTFFTLKNIRIAA